ncbi:MAG: dihydrodipicolinate synthase family protein [Gemmatimonadetes bacterium]|nr:dihydrodipicolinate synthase family protein [Gemmatimonadota bacterium]
MGVHSVDLRGTFLPVTTPFDPVTGDVDVVAFRANLRHWFQSPIAGILIGGTTGEGVLLDDPELVKLLEAAAAVMPAGSVLIAGTGAESTRRTIRLSREAAAAGADVALVSPPAFFKGAMTPEALARHYRAVADASPIPVIVYQVPLRMSTLDLPTGLVAELSHHGNIAGIKDSRGKLDLVGELVEQCQEGFHVLVGNGALLYAALETGAAGGVVAVGLLATAAAAGIPAAYREGRKADAGRMQERIAPLHQQIVSEMGISGVKAALDLLGLHGGVPRPPLSPASADRVEAIRRILGTAELLPHARV